MRFRVIAVVASLILPATGRAQSSRLVPIPYRTYIAVNPAGIPFDIASAEFETALATGITAGALGSYTSFEDDRFSTIDVKFRYYPGEVVLNGFSFGLSVGGTRYRHTSKDLAGQEVRASADFSTLGLLVDHNWMLGAQHRFIVGAGVGAKRVLASTAARERVNIDRAYATARFVIGIAF